MSTLLVRSPASQPGHDREVFLARLERLRLRAMRTIGSVRPLPEAQRAHLDTQLADAERAIASMRQGNRERRLATLLDLDDIELDLVWFVVAVTADPLFGPHAVELGGSEARRGATLALFAAVAGVEPGRARELGIRLCPSHPLLRLRFIEATDRAGIMALSPLRASRRLIGFLAGQDDTDEDLARVVIPPRLVFDSGAEAARQCIARALTAPHLVIVEGPDGVGRKTAVARAAAEHGRAAAYVDLRRLGSGVTELEEALALLERECLLASAVPIVAGVEALADAEGDGRARRLALSRALQQVAGPVVLVGTGGGGVDIDSFRSRVQVRIPVPAPRVRRALWEAALGHDDPGLDDLAVRYRLGSGGIDRAVRAARAAAHTRDAVEPSPRDLVEGVRLTVQTSLAELAQRVDVPHSWTDLVLPDDVRLQLDALVARVRHGYQVLETWGFKRHAPRGGGLAVLLSGPPGTGKTMVAGLLAREMGVDLYQVDLSRVVSKWVGETEKNLSRLFDAADAGHAMLLFDEADALFARRTEVRSSNDRFANLEVNHLLQRIEAFGGLAVLTTNMDAVIDPALRRRLAGHVVFYPPDADERRRLWTRMLEGGPPLGDDIDVAALARKFPDLAGGHIRNAALAAAFLAAAEGVAIRQAHLLRAAGDEYRATGRIYLDEKGPT